MTTKAENEMQVRNLIENWAKAVRQKNIIGVPASHSENCIMCDVPEQCKTVS
jgi:ketosteroid isomerase-like protein